MSESLQVDEFQLTRATTAEDLAAMLDDLTPILRSLTTQSRDFE